MAFLNKLWRKIKLQYYKECLAHHYLKKRRMADEMDCGEHLTKVLSSDYSRIEKKVNYYWGKCQDLEHERIKIL